MSHMNAWYWHLLERTVYRQPAPSPPRRRAPDNPMQVLCVGFPRTGTESLQQALLRLGYDHAYHGWDVLFEEPLCSAGWATLCRRKFWGGSSSGSDSGSGDGGDGNGDCAISADEFDALLGHCAAVTDAAASVFAAELVAAYPDARVVLNVRRDEEAWFASLRQTLLETSYDSWVFWIASWFDGEMFWAWHVYHRFMWPGLFRVQDGDVRAGVMAKAKWVYREHNNMIRGLVPRERLLEWSVEDGWEPLCGFLGKEIPGQEFPHANTRGEGFKAREEQVTKRWVGRAFRNMVIATGVVVAGGAAAYRVLRK